MCIRREEKSVRVTGNKIDLSRENKSGPPNSEEGNLGPREENATSKGLFLIVKADGLHIVIWYCTEVVSYTMLLLRV